MDGADQFRELADRIRAEGGKDQSRAMGEALRKAAEPARLAITREAEQAMPEEGGYRGEFMKSLRFRMSQRRAGRTAQVILRTYADGTSERRDIRALERGVLRHPVFGRSRRLRTGARAGTALANPWAVTTIRGGFHERGTQNASRDTERELGKVLDQMAERMAK